MFTDDAANDKMLGPPVFPIHYGAQFKADESTSTWVGSPSRSYLSDAIMSTTYGTGAKPTANAYATDPMSPFAGSVKHIECWYYVSSTTCQGELAWHKHAWTSGSSTVVSTLIGSCAIASGGNSAYRYDASIDVDVAVAAGDVITVHYRSAGSPTGGDLIYYSANVLIERTA
jgi:hypothetical protein